MQMIPQNNRQYAYHTTAVRFSDTREYHHVVPYDLDEYEADDTTKLRAVGSIYAYHTAARFLIPGPIFLLLYYYYLEEKS